MKAFRIMSITETGDDANSVIVCVYCPDYPANRKYLEDKYAWRVLNFKDETEIEDVLQREINRELLRLMGIEKEGNDFHVIAAQVFGITDRDTAMLMKLELGSD